MRAAPAGAVPAIAETISTPAVHASPTIALIGVGRVEMVNTKAS
jgi:hypothetical protein